MFFVYTISIILYRNIEINRIKRRPTLIQQKMFDMPIPSAEIRLIYATQHQNRNTHSD